MGEHGSGDGISHNRLASFRGIRDLSLGLSMGRGDAKPRKNYVPNLNVRRNKSKEEEFLRNDPFQKGDFKRGQGRGSFRGRGRDAGHFIQETSSIFAEGSAIAQSRRFIGDGRGDGAGSHFIPKPKLNLQHDRKVNKEEEELKLRELLRDDFVDDPGLDPDCANKPIQLPFHATDISTIKETKCERKCIKEDIVIGGVKIKKEPDERKKFAHRMEDGRGDGPEKEVEDPELNERTVGDFFKHGPSRLFFLQLPDALPGLKSEPDVLHARPSTSKQPSAAIADTSESTSAEIRSTDCMLDSLAEGYMGKIQVLKSGKARIVVNDCVIHLASSLQTGFREDLVSVDLDPATHMGEMTNLGQVEARLLCSPHWESMLSCSKK